MLNKQILIIILIILGFFIILIVPSDTMEAIYKILIIYGVIIYIGYINTLLHNLKSRVEKLEKEIMQNKNKT